MGVATGKRCQIESTCVNGNRETGPQVKRDLSFLGGQTQMAKGSAQAGLAQQALTKPKISALPREDLTRPGGGYGITHTCARLLSIDSVVPAPPVFLCAPMAQAEALMKSMRYCMPVMPRCSSDQQKRWEEPGGLKAETALAGSPQTSPCLHIFSKNHFPLKGQI
ncbi:unnamed protein product [Leuciscus chuanchicus]